MTMMQSLLAPATLGFIGGILGTAQIAILVVLLFTTTGIFFALNSEYPTEKSFAIAAGLYVLMAGYALIYLS